MDHAHSESSPLTSASADKPRRYSDDFKRDAVRLITEEQYKFTAAPLSSQAAPSPGERALSTGSSTGGEDGNLGSNPEFSS